MRAATQPQPRGMGGVTWHGLTIVILPAVASIVGVAGLHHWARAQQLSSAAAGRAVCIGMGSGSVPLFLSHHFPQLQVSAALSV